MPGTVPGSRTAGEQRGYGGSSAASLFKVEVSDFSATLKRRLDGHSKRHFKAPLEVYPLEEGDRED